MAMKLKPKPAGPILLIVLALAGALKVLPVAQSLPVDLTVLSLCLVLLAVARQIVARRFRVPRRVNMPMLVLVALFPATMWSTWSEYGTAKITELFTITAVCMVAPIVLIRTKLELRVLLAAIAASGLLLAGGVLFGLDVDQYGRGSAFGESPLHAASWGSALVVMAFLLGVHNVGSPRRALALFIVAAAAVVAVVSTGTRASLGNIVIAITVTLLFSRQSRMRRGVRLLILVPVLILGFNIGLQVAPEAATERISGLLADFSGDSSASLRMEAFTESALLFTTPWGVGLGDWVSHMPRSLHLLIYPHNLLLEVGAEAGWIALLVLSFYFAAAFRQAHRHSATPDGQIIFGVLALLALQAMTRGDINSHRLLYVVASTCLALPEIMQAWQPDPLTPRHFATQPVLPEPVSFT